MHDIVGYQKTCIGNALGNLIFYEIWDHAGNIQSNNLIQFHSSFVRLRRHISDDVVGNYILANLLTY